MCYPRAAAAMNSGRQTSQRCRVGPCIRRPSRINFTRCSRQREQEKAVEYIPIFSMREDAGTLRSGIVEVYRRQNWPSNPRYRYEVFAKQETTDVRQIRRTVVIYPRVSNVRVGGANNCTPALNTAQNVEAKACDWTVRLLIRPTRVPCRYSVCGGRKRR